MRNALLIAATGLSTACAAQTAAPPGDGPREPGAFAEECDARAGQRFVGEMASPETGERLLAATGARQLRWAPPRSALTMDYRVDRLTVEYDDEMKIIEVRCG